MGRAAGNCHTELLVSHLKNPRYDVRPVLGVIEKHMLKIREVTEWGYNIPYMIAGSFNQHPRAAMAVRDNAEIKDNYLDFYDQVTSVEAQGGK
jgi:4-hydroxy 2-oxovalerate aldolase